MRGERATLGKSLLDVQRELKIKATYIAAIENADPTAFETQGFIAGYVRSYARYLGLDPEWAYAQFCKESNFSTSHGMSPAASAPRGSATAERPGQARGLGDPDALFVPRGEGLISRIEPGAIGSVLVLLSLIVVIGYGGWSVFREIQKVQFAPVEQAPAVASAVDVIEPDAEVLAALEETSGLLAPGADALDRLYRPEALDVPVLVARDAPIATLDPTTVGALAARPLRSEPLPQVAASAPPEDTEVSAAIDAASASVQVVAEEAPEVVLFAVRPSWVRVRAADGTVLFEKILDAGERYVIPATEDPPVLRAGNAGSVYFMVGGQTYGPAGEGPSVVKNLVLSAEELSSRFQVADLGKDVDLARFIAVAQARAAEE